MKGSRYRLNSKIMKSKVQIILSLIAIMIQVSITCTSLESISFMYAPLITVQYLHRPPHKGNDLYEPTTARDISSF